MNVKYSAPATFVDPNLWEHLYHVKLNVHKLSKAEEKLKIALSCSSSKFNSFFELSKSSFVSQETNSIRGKLLNLNTIEEFRDIDKKKLLYDSSHTILTSILNGNFAVQPSVLCVFILLTFADLKSYKFTYWFGSPAIIPDTPFSSSSNEGHLRLWRDSAISGAIESFYRSIAELMYQNNEVDVALMAFKYNITTNQFQLLTIPEAWSQRYASDVYFVFPDMSSSPDTLGWTVRNILTAFALHNTGIETKTINIIGLRGNIAEKLLRSYYNGKHHIATVDNNIQNNENTVDNNNNYAKVLSTADIVSSEDIVSSDTSVCLQVTIPTVTQCFGSALHSFNITMRENPSLPLGYELVIVATHQQTLDSYSNKNNVNNVNNTSNDSSNHMATINNSLKVVGWEANERGKAGPRVADLSNVLNSSYLMNQAVDLNIKLMKWRMWEELDTELLSSTKCLLLGAGTLGCAVARSLLGWGIKHITFVDSGKVSYSNPARQCLFEFEDCEKKVYKAIAAANRLKKIFPEVQSEGIVMSIPMPGHPMNETAATTINSSNNEAATDQSNSDNNNKNTTAKSRIVTNPVESTKVLDELIQSHDVCFALTDSREARWLPTVLSSAYDKLLINAALGFDTYLVMRHGHGTTVTTTTNAVTTNSYLNFDRLGCYFCNDIVAASNSLKDRTLDQQCTVTRPGLSFIASALSVEMMVDLLHSKYYHRHPVINTYTNNKSNNNNEDEGFNNAANNNKPIAKDRHSGDIDDSIDMDDDSNNNNNNNNDNELRTIPHQIRGSLSGYTQFSPQSPAFPSCTACCHAIVDTYKQDGIAFVQRACQDSKILEEISGVNKLMSEVDLDLCVDSDEDF